MPNSSIAMIEQIAEGLADLRDKIVFVGGATLPCYINDPTVQNIRATDDVDCVIRLAKRNEFYAVEEKLSKLGFSHCTEVGSPICRWTYRGVRVDVMPTDSSVLGFSNVWYSEGVVSPDKYILPSTAAINILKLPYFIASKIEAFQGRGKGDFTFSSDMEDIISVVDGNTDVQNSLTLAPSSVKSYIKDNFTQFLSDKRFMRSIEAHLPYPAELRASKVIGILKALTAPEKGLDR